MQSENNSVNQTIVLEASENNQTRFEDALQDSENLFQAVAESSLDSIHITDIKGNIVYWNKAAENLFGYDKSEVLGKSNTILMPDWVKDIAKKGRQKFFKTGVSNFNGKPFESSILDKDGTEFPVEITISKWEMNEQIFFTCILRNIKKRKQQQNNLNRFQNNESISTLAGGIAHEFNNILGGITGYTEIAADDAHNDGPVLESLDEILKLCNRASDVVKQILTFSRNENNDLKSLQPHLTIEKSIKVLQKEFPSNIEIKLNIDENSGTIMADSTQLYQVGLSLCLNAAHAMEENGGRLKIGLEPVVLDIEDVKQNSCLKPGAYMKLTVSDNGTGIDPKIIDRIFDPFFTTKGVGKGSGMGLAVVHGIVKSYGGAISVSSKPGEGTTFTVFLPKVAEKTEEQKSYDVMPAGTESILLVDDEEHLAFPMKIILERLGYTVTAMTNSLKTLELFKKDPQKYDLIISDLTMPHLPGDKLASEIMAIRPDIPVIIISGHTDAVAAERLNHSGIRAFIPKPCQKQDLAKTVRLILDEK